MDLDLLLMNYRRAAEARQRYVLGVGLAKVDAKVDHQLMLRIEYCHQQIANAGGADSAWFRRTWNEVTDQVRHDLSV
jgi:hypothetical protein